MKRTNFVIHLKRCGGCKQEKDKSLFYKDSHTKNGYACYCKRCDKHMHIKLYYNLSLEEYNVMFEQQKGCCAICGIHQSNLKKDLSIDHNHKTAEIRGLLCGKCNHAIGLLNDDYFLVKKALKYLKQYKNI